ncbi:LOW QUALITY PROTEIN: lanC-like protein 3 [Liolophura sinensis]|uniref:LOW QUALITY PROTEIN: lanC-like protein 3 n=1 Tax=Liolophura sinensis TaxID=3198878 RepID=UPI0031588ED7
MFRKIFCLARRHISLCANMTDVRGRFFVNQFPDYDTGSIVTIDESRWSDAVRSLADEVYENMKPEPDNSGGGLYVGNAGLAYMFYYLSKIKHLSAKREKYLEKAMEYLEQAIAHINSKSCRDPVTSFIIGKTGVYAVGSVILNEIGSDKSSKMAVQFAQVANVCKTAGDFLGCGSDELFIGRAGYLCGVLFLHKALGRKVVGDKDIHGVCAAIVKSGRDYAKTHHSPCPLMYAYYKAECLGAAHGLSSILQMLLSFPDYLQSDPATEADVKASVDFMLSLEQPNFNYALAMDEVGAPRSEADQLVHWCHGAPGIILFGRAYVLWKEERFLEACVRCGEITWKCGLLRKGPGICHGVAGNGYVFLLLFRLTKDPKYLYRAQKFAEFIFTPDFKSGARRPDTPYSLYEGWAGTACFLGDLLQPDKAEFPFFDVL